MYLFLIMTIFAEPAFAYLDPGTGSYMFQLLTVGILGSLFYAKSIIRRIKNFINKLGVRKNDRE